MPLPVLKATIGTPFFRQYGRDFVHTFETLYGCFEQGQATGDNNLCVEKINEVFGDDQEKYQIFLAQLATFLVRKQSNVDVFSTFKERTVARVDCEYKLAAAQKKISKVKACLSQEQIKLGKIDAKRIGWYDKWKHKKISATISKLEQLYGSTENEIQDILNYKSFMCTNSICADFDEQKSEINTNKNYINFLNFLGQTADQKLSDYNTLIENVGDTENIPEINKYKGMLLQSCVCIQATTKIAVQNFTGSVQQFNESLELFKAKKQFFVADADYHTFEKINHKVTYSNSNEKEKNEAAVVVEQPKSAKIFVFIENAIKHVIKKMKETPRNPTLNLAHPTHAEGELSANALPLTDYMDGVKYQSPIVSVKKQVDVDVALAES